jgi:Fic family protein
MTAYIHDLKRWPSFSWDQAGLSPLLAEIHRRQGRLQGRMEHLGFKFQEETELATLTEDIVKSSEIEGEVLDRDKVRSSVARRLGLDVAAVAHDDRHIEGVVAMALDATQNYARALTKERLFGWHAGLFPTGYSGIHKIIVGAWRDDADGPMQVVSGRVGREQVHYQAPAAERLDREMDAFLAWFNGDEPMDPVLRAAVAHLWFVTIHPFEDGNGRIARAIADMALARSEHSRQRFYSMSAEIRAERDAYYDRLERTQKGDLDITAWLTWFLQCLDRAFDGADKTLDAVLSKARFWERLSGQPINERQRKVLNRLLDGFEGKLQTSKWAALTKSSTDTALRDIADLVERGILVKEPGGGRSTSYRLVPEA